MNHPLPQTVKLGPLKEKLEILEEFHGTRAAKKVSNAGRKRPPVVTAEPQEEKRITVDPRVEIPAAPSARHAPAFMPLKTHRRGPSCIHSRDMHRSSTQPRNSTHDHGATSQPYQ